MTPGARLAAIVGALGLVLGLAGTAALFVGSAAVTPASVLAVLAGSERAEAVAVVVVLDLRLPRIIVAALPGGALAVAGGAVFGGGTGQPFGRGLSVLEAIGLTAFAFAGAFVAGGAVYLIASTAAGLPVHTLLLAGVIVGIFFSSALTVLLSLVDTNRLGGVIHWLLGSVAPIPPGPLLVFAALTAIGVALIGSQARRLNLPALGEAAARQL